MSEVQEELRNIRNQMKSDFEFMAAGLNFSGKKIGELAETMAREMAEVTERLSQVEGRLRLQEQRFNRVLEAVELALDDWKPEVNDLRRRVEALEQSKDNPAD